MSLREYARKRRFDGTPEPSGEGATKRRGKRPIFVVQLHHARARHYDFRLEIDGALKSWAVPKGPSLRTGEKRLAVEVEDHPLDYAGFEGDIPEGHYGAGHVDVFDHGVWSSQGDPLEAMAAGKLDFVLEGAVLRGGWKLVRTGMRGAKPQWLLIKRDDAEAIDAEADDFVPPDKGGTGRSPPKRASRAKAKSPSNRKAAAPRKAKRKTKRQDWADRARALDGARDWRGPLPQPQLATLKSAPPPGDGWLHELKWDGYRMLADIEKGRVRLRSRNGLDWTDDHPHIVAALEALRLDHGCLDGELIALDTDGRSDFAALQHTLSGRDTATLRYVVFDLPVLEHVDLTRTTLVDRKALLEQLLVDADADANPGAVAYSQHIVGHGARVFEASGGQGMEGIISKAVDAPYTPGRSATWLKIKHSQADEFVVVGYTAPKGSRRGFGSLLLATFDHGRMRYVGRVGTGFNDALLRRLGDRLRRDQRKAAVLELPAHVPFKAGDVHWVEPAVVVEVAYRGWGKEGLLRHASFMRIRDDKGVRDVGEQATTEDATTISSPARVVYPALKLTKQDVADYYRAIAPHLLPEVVNRPLSLLRCPDGVEGTCFFQKHHADALGANVHATPIREKDGGNDDYLFIDDLAGLMDLVQMNTLELHPWGARVGDVEHPDRLVFDLDPGEGVAWKAIVAGARDIRDKLEQAGLASFVRLSGGKGLHVVAPIQRGPTWTQVRDFCEAFADAMATHQPTRYVATASKAKRKGVIFIDWLRNGRGATSVASWSLRARKEAGVAVPLRWSELGRTRSGADYPMARALQRAARLKGDVWEGWDAATRQAMLNFN